MLYLEPIFDELKAGGFRDEVDPVLQSQAANWYALDWAVWSILALSGLALLTALMRPAHNGTNPQTVVPFEQRRKIDQA